MYLEKNKLFKKILSFHESFTYTRLLSNNRENNKIYLVELNIFFSQLPNVSPSRLSNIFPHPLIATPTPTPNILIINNNQKNIYKKYIYKIFKKSKAELDLIIKVLNFLNKNKFPSAKLLYYEYNLIENSLKIKNNNKNNNLYEIYFIYEFLNTNQTFDLFNEIHMEKFIYLLKEFYNLSENFKGLDSNMSLLDKISISSQKLNSKLNKEIINSCILELKKSLNMDNSTPTLIIRDLNSSNIMVNSNNFYLIDFDEIGFGDLEFDIAQIYLNFSFAKNLLDNISFISNIIKNLDFTKRINTKKLINYIILILYYEILFYLDSKSKINKNLNIIINLYKNKNLFIKNLNNLLKL